MTATKTGLKLDGTPGEMPFIIDEDIFRRQTTLRYIGTVRTLTGPKDVEFSSVVCDDFGKNVLKLIDLYRAQAEEIAALKRENAALRNGMTTEPPWQRDKKKTQQTPRSE